MANHSQNTLFTASLQSHKSLNSLNNWSF